VVPVEVGPLGLKVGKSGLSTERRPESATLN
jgi:ATP-dependent Clp protease ATP-binding subunit ClpB